MLNYQHNTIFPSMKIEKLQTFVLKLSLGESNLYFTSKTFVFSETPFSLMASMV